MLPETLTDSTEHGPDAVGIQVAVVELPTHHTALVPDHQEPPAVKGVELTKLLICGPDRLALDNHHNLALDKGCGAGGHSGKGPGRILFLFRKSFFENACGKTLSHYNKTIL